VGESCGTCGSGGCRDAVSDHWPSDNLPDCTTAGWAAPKGFSAYSTPLDVDLYIDDVFFKRMTANGSEHMGCSQNPNKAQCGHGFAYTFTPSDLSYGTHSISVEAPDSCGNYGKISNSPQTITCAALTPTPTIAPNAPNCSNLSGPAIIVLGQSGTYSANFYSPQGALGAEIFYDNFNSIIYQTLTDYLSAAWTPPAAGSYKVRCRAWNDAIAECRPSTMGPFTPPVYSCAGPGTEITVNVITPTPTPTPATVTVSGTVYDGSGWGLNKCTGLQQPVDPSVIASSEVTVSPDGKDGPVQGNGFYQVFQVEEAGPKTIILSDMDPGYYCTCPGNNCQYSGANLQISGVTGWDFYVSNILAGWAQVVGGHVHGQTGVTVAVPAGKYFMIAGSFSNNPGAATKTSGSIITFPGSLSTTNWNLTDTLVQTSWRYSYHRLWVRAGSPTTSLPADGNKPPAGFYQKSGDLTIDGGWTGMSGETVIFVDGDVTIETDITLADPEDGFFAVIVSGNINVNQTVGDAVVASPAAGDADLVGAFLAEGNFNGGSDLSQTDKQLVVYGTIGADIDLGTNSPGGRVNFQRDMGVNNSIGPGVSVIWNPNLLLNWPAELSDALTDWREVAP